MPATRIFGIVLVCLSVTPHLYAFEYIVDLEYRYQRYRDNSYEKNTSDYIARIELSEYLDNWEFTGKVKASVLAEADYELFDDRLFVDILTAKRMFDSADVIIGRQDLRFGRATFINPTDYFDPRDYRDVLLSENRRLPTDALHSVFYSAQSQYSFTISPRKTRSYMPNTDSRWFFDMPREFDAGNNIIIPIQYVWADYDSGETDFSDPQYLLRFEHTMTRFSFSLSYFKGTDNIPLFEAGEPLLEGAAAIIAVDQIFPDKTAYGFDLEASFDTWILRAEAAHIELRSPGRDTDRYQHYVFGGDANFNNGLFDKDIYFAIEYSKQYSDRIDSYQREDIRHLFKNTLFAKLDIDLDVFNTIGINALYDTGNYQKVFNLSWENLFSDQLSLELSADIIRGGEDTFFGQYKDNGRLGFNLEYVF